MMRIRGIQPEDKAFYIIMIIVCTILMYIITALLFGKSIERNNEKLKYEKTVVGKAFFHPFASFKALLAIFLPILFGEDMAAGITTRRRFWIESLSNWLHSHITLIVIITVVIIAVLVGTVLLIRKRQQYNSNQNHNQTN